MTIDKRKGFGPTGTKGYKENPLKPTPARGPITTPPPPPPPPPPPKDN
jgi:hypothetical protein